MFPGVNFSLMRSGEIKSIKPEMPIAPTVDIYDPLTEEILLFDDGIGVKKQKETRQKKPDVVMTESDSPQKKQKRKTVITDIVLLQTPQGSFESLTSPIDNQGQSLITLEEIVT